MRPNLPPVDTVSTIGETPQTPVNNNHKNNSNGNDELISPDSEKTLVTPDTPWGSPISKRNTLNISENLQVEYGEVIGRGCFCNAYMVPTTGRSDEKKKPHKDVYAIKTPLKESNVDMLFHEAKILSLLPETNIGIEKYQGMIYSDFFPYKHGIILDYYKYTLKSYLSKKSQDKNILPLNEVFVGEKLWYQWARQLSQGLSTLQSYNVIHGDIKSENIFLDDQLNAYLGDFSSSHQYLSEHSPTMAFSIAFSAPELLKKKDSAPTFSSDVYSLGLVLLNAATGLEPYNSANKSISQKLMWAQKGYALTYCSDEEFIRMKPVLSILQQFVTHRKSMNEILPNLEHSYL